MALIQWKIIDPWGQEAERVEGERYDSYDEAREMCDWLHEKEGLDTDDGFGVYLPHYRAVTCDHNISSEHWNVVMYRKDAEHGA